MVSNGNQDPFLQRDDAATWQKYCGFFDLSVPQFMAVQEHLLLDQLAQFQASPLAKRINPGLWPRTVDEFRRVVRFTTYDDYEDVLSVKDERALVEKPLFWTFTTVVGQRVKWIPLTRRAYYNNAAATLSAFLLACADRKGQVNLTNDDRVLYSVAPRPFLTGYIARGMKEIYHFDGAPSLEEHESFAFEKVLEFAFRRALQQRVSVLVGLSSVLVRVGEQFAEKTRSSGFSWSMLHPRTASRLLVALLRSKLQRRPILPKDLWPVKSLISWGIDTQLYRHKILEYWGKDPLELYASTETGIMALQSWNRKAMTLLPHSAFLEFVPEHEVVLGLKRRTYQPLTLLLDELEAGKRYEVVATSFFGMPFLRYRLGHLVRVHSLKDDEAGIALPQIEYVGRADDLIDIGGFTRLDERTLWQAMVQSTVPFRDWVVRKEYQGESAILHLYLELKDAMEPEKLKGLVRQSLKQADSAYKDVEEMLGLDPLRVTVLPKGSFDRYITRLSDSTGRLQDRSRMARVNISDLAVAELLKAAYGDGAG